MDHCRQSSGVRRYIRKTSSNLRLLFKFQTFCSPERKKPDKLVSDLGYILYVLIRGGGGGGGGGGGVGGEEKMRGHFSKRGFTRMVTCNEASWSLTRMVARTIPNVYKSRYLFSSFSSSSTNNVKN